MMNFLTLTLDQIMILAGSGDIDAVRFACRCNRRLDLALKHARGLRLYPSEQEALADLCHAMHTDLGNAAFADI